MKVVILAGEWVRGSARRHPPGQSPWSKLGEPIPPCSVPQILKKFGILRVNIQHYTDLIKVWSSLILSIEDSAHRDPKRELGYGGALGNFFKG